MTAPNELLQFPAHDWTTVPVERIADGIERQMIWASG